MARELAGAAALYRRAPDGSPAPLTPAEVAVAKARLRRFSGVLLMERWGDSMRLMRARCGWNDTDYEAHRAGSRQ